MQVPSRIPVAVPSGSSSQRSSQKQSKILKQEDIHQDIDSIPCSIVPDARQDEQKDSFLLNVSTDSAYSGFDKILHNIDKMAQVFRQQDAKDRTFISKAELDSMITEQSTGRYHLVDLEERAKQLHQEILSSLGESRLDNQTQEHEDLKNQVDDLLGSQNMYLVDDNSLQNMPIDEDMELIGLLKSKIGLDLLKLDESLSNWSCDNEDSDSSATVDLDLQKHQQDSCPIPTTQVLSKPDTVREIISIPNQYSGLSVACRELELSEQISEKPTSIWIEYSVVESEDPVRFQVKLPLRSLKTSTIPLKFERCHRIPDWNAAKTPSLYIRIFAVGKSRNNASKSKSESVELWSASGAFKLTDLLHNKDFKISTQVLLLKDVAGLPQPAKFNAANVFGQLLLEIFLTKTPQPDIASITAPVVTKTPPPIYLSLHLSTIRGLRPSQDSFLLNIRFKVAKGDILIETVPIAYSDEFDIDTGELVPPANFKYTLTRPFQCADISSLPSPMIVEIHKHPSNRPGSIKGRELLGLLKLPLASLVKAWDSEGNVEIPESEYGIVDPISGDCVGWVSAKLCIYNQLLLPKGEADDLCWSPLVSPIVPDEEIKECLEKEAGNTDDANSGKHDDPFPDPNHSETTSLHVTVHKACGLLSLLEAAEESDATSIAMERGPNIFVTLDLFPDGESDISDLITTPVVVYSFTPSFDYSIQITVSCQDSELLRWIRKGAVSMGKIYHRVPRHLVVNGVDSIFLGEFRINLDSLISSPNGIDAEWFAVQGGGAVQISLCFDNGLHDWNKSVPTIHPIPTSSSSWMQFWLDLHINGVIMDSKTPLENVSLQYRVPGLTDVSHLGNLDKVMGYKTTLELTVDSFKSTIVPLNFTQHSLSDPDYHEYLGTAFLNLDKEIQQAKVVLRSKSKSNGDGVFPTFKKLISLVQVDCAEWLDIVVQVSFQIRVERKKRRNVNIHPVDNSAYLSESFIENISRIEQVKVEDEVMDNLEEVLVEKNFALLDHPIPVQPQKISDNPALSPISSPPQPFSKLESVAPALASVSIPIHITIEKAMNLPLVSDPLGTSFPSPFVKSSDSFTSTLPNAFITLSPPLKFFNIANPTDMVSNIQYNQTNPIWNFQINMMLQLERGSSAQLRDLRKPLSAFRFKVWHTPVDSEEDHSLAPLPSDEDECLGICQVSLDPLFSGMTEIHGWYPIQDTDGINKGQLMVRICPTQDLGMLLRDWTQKYDVEEPSHSLHLPNPSAISPKPFYFLGSPSKPEILKPENVAKPQETFVWNGTQWVQRSLPSTQDVPPQPNHTTLSSSLFEKGISDTINELDNLRRSMMTKLEKLNTSPSKSPGHLSKSTQSERIIAGTDAAIQAMSLPISQVEETDQTQLFHDHSSNPFKDDSLPESKIAFELSQYDTALKASANFSASMMDTTDPAIMRTHDLMNKLDSLELADPSFHSESFVSAGEVYASPTRQQLKDLLQTASQQRPPILETSKPPLPPAAATITYQSGISSAPKWKELDLQKIQATIDSTTASDLPHSTAATASQALTDTGVMASDSSLSLMQQKLGNVSLESSTRIANILRKSTSSSNADLDD